MLPTHLVHSADGRRGHTLAYLLRVIMKAHQFSKT
jgi:hypothetical protein